MANKIRTNMGNISIVGRISYEARVNNSMRGEPICNFSVAVNEDFEDEETGEFGTTVKYYNIVELDPNRAERVASMVNVGEMVAVAGRLSLAEEDGYRPQLEIRAQRYNFKGNPIALTEAELAENERLANPEAAAQRDAQIVLNEAKEALAV